MIIARFFCKVYCSLKGHQKDIKDNCFLKMSMYLSNIFNESTTITTILTFSNTKPRLFVKKYWFLTIGKTSYIPSNFLSYIRNCFINQSKNYIFMIKKDGSFRDQNLQSTVIL